MIFTGLKNPNDPSRVNEQMVVTLDAQLFYSVLSALPYLVNYPYECTEQTLNRFVSTGILSSLYKNYPAVARMAAGFCKARHAAGNLGCGRPEPQDGARGNALARPMPRAARTPGTAWPTFSIRASPRPSRSRRSPSCARRRRQTARFPWWPGGPPSPYMTLYIMYGFAKASEFGVDVPEGHGGARLGVPGPALPRGVRGENDAARLLLGIPDVPELRGVLLPGSVLDGKRAHRRRSARTS